MNDEQRLESVANQLYGMAIHQMGMSSDARNRGVASDEDWMKILLQGRRLLATLEERASKLDAQGRP